MSAIINTFKSLIISSSDTYPDDIPFDESPCLSCPNPCTTHEQLPAYLAAKIDTTTPLLNTVKPYHKHIFICTHSTNFDWPEKIDKVSHSLANTLRAVLDNYESKLKIKITMTACDRHNLVDIMKVSSDGEILENCDLMVFPENKLITNVNLENCEEVMKMYFESGVVDETKTGSKIVQMTEEKFVFVCSHKKRDKRCGVAGPLIIDAFKKSLKKHNISEHKIPVYGTSHTGGHKFAGNVIIFPNGHWYGRVNTCHVDHIVEKHLMEETVVKELWRGKMTEEKTDQQRIEKEKMQW
ncbi:Sucrase/ferredoxin-like-domain-containing protein [Paraphysoderma sedebokerense]|nr:Sucrase/ferredoxin-like-domain-containing protein [Paraphysoderma sedebokerense]KAI9137854.1 Sucrase/ferredoxin-like-domain-containing protein [Paraphysoderma sedebokerense]